MDLKNLRIGYVPYSPNLSAVCDRRRFPYYAKSRGLSFEVFRPGGTYDLVVLSTQGDLSYWARGSKNCPLILDMPDGYLSNPLDGLVDKAKALYKFATGSWRYFESSFHDVLSRVAEKVDAVVCANPEQAADVLPYNRNAFHVLDFHGSDFTRKKSSYVAQEPFRLVWEGVGDSLQGFRSAAKGIAEAASGRPLELHILTDLRFRPINRPFKICTARLVEELLPDVRTYLYQWNLAFFGEIVTNCDLAVIPMLPNNPMTRVKPENRLLLFWKMGLPVLTSDTPAFDRVMKSVGLYTCGSQEAWRDSIIEIMESELKRKENAQLGGDYIEENCSDEILAENWDRILTDLF